MQSPHTTEPVVTVSEPAAEQAVYPMRRKRRRVRWVIRVAIGLPLLAVLAGLLLIRSPLVGRMVASQVREQLGCVLEVDACGVTLGGRLEVLRPRLIAPDLESEAAQILAADRAVVELDWSGFPFRSPRPSRVRLYAPVLRVSVATEDGSINIDGLEIAEGAPGAAPKLPPIIDLFDGRLEFGEHSLETGRYEALTTLPVAGHLTPDQGSATAFTFKLEQTAPATGSAPFVGAARPGMILQGNVDLETSDAQLSLHNVNLDEWPPEVIPSSVRDLWRRLNVQGKVSLASFRYTHQQGVEAAVTVDNVSMDALVPADRPEVAPDKPLKLTNVSGTIRLSRGGVDALLEGMVGDLPGRVSLRAAGPSMDAPLRCEITTQRFRVSENPELMPFLPSIVRKRFASFSGPTAVVDARVLIERGEPVDGVAAPLRISGSLAFEGGKAAFDKFPYPFQDLRGLVTFDDEKIEIVNIQGRGPTGAILFADGRIAPPTDNPSVRIDVVVLDVPIDDTLRTALPEDRRGVIDELFSVSQHQDLLARGLVISPADRAAAEKELEEAGLRREFLVSRGGATPSALAELDARIAAARERLRAPAFELGGVAQLTVQVTREEGEGQPFAHATEVRFPRAGILPREFPFPFTATNVVLHVDEQHAVLTSGEFAGLAGGSAELEASIGLRDENDRPHFSPNVRVAATGIPVDRLLLNAVPERSPAAETSGEKVAQGGGEASDHGERISPKRLLESLRIAGMVDCTATITPAPPELRAAGRRIALDVLVGLNNLSASPAAPEGAPSLVLDAVNGVIRVDDDALTVQELSGRVGVLPAGGAPGGAVADAGRITLEAVAGFADPARGKAGTMAAKISATDLEIAAPLEQAVALVSPKSAGTLSSLRNQHRAGGRVDAQVTLNQAGAKPADLDVRVSGARGLEFDALGGRFNVDLSRGVAALRMAERDRVAFEGASAAVAFNGRPTLNVDLDGVLPLLSRDSAYEADPADGVTARLHGVRLESQLARAAYSAITRSPAPATDPKAALVADGSADGQKARAGADAMEQMDLRGRLDAELTLRPRVNRPAGAPVAQLASAGPMPAALPVGEAQPAPSAGKGGAVTSPSWSRYAVSGAIWPRSFSMVHQGNTVDVPLIEGRIVLEENGGRIEGLRAVAAADHWRLGLDGTWQSKRDEWGSGVKVDSILSLSGNELEPGLVALLPKRIRETVEKSKLRIAGPFSIEGAKAAFWIPGKQSGGAADASAQRPDVAPGAGQFLFDGKLNFKDLSVNVGLPIDRGAGSLAVLVQQNRGEKSPVVDLTLRADTLTVANLPMTGAKARIVSGSAPGQLLIPHLVADLFGGRITASGVLGGLNGAQASPGRAPQGSQPATASAAPGGGGVITLNKGTTFQFSATIAGARFAPIAAAGASLDGKGRRAANFDPMDESRGRLDGSVSLSGTLGDDNSRFGRGSVRISGGEVLQLPGLVRMLELSNLQLPTSERLDYVQAGFDLKGRRLTFEEIAVMSESVSIMGSGVLTLPDMGLNFRFNSQAAAGRRIPIVSGVFEALRNELITTVVGGTLKQPKIKTDSFSGTRKAFAGIFGGGKEDQAPKFDAKAGEKAARAERDRLRARAPQSAPDARVLTLPTPSGSASTHRPAPVRPREPASGSVPRSGDLR